MPHYHLRYTGMKVLRGTATHSISVCQEASVFFKLAVSKTKT